jgi:hypothetical protein
MRFYSLIASAGALAADAGEDGASYRRAAVRMSVPSKAAVRERAENELKEFAIIASYLFIVFGALVFFKSAILQGEGINWTPWGFAAVKAAVAAKFILIGRAFHVGEGHRGKPLVWQTLHKSFAFLVLVAVLTVIEEALVGLIHGKTAWQSISEMGGGTSEQMVATLVIMFLVLLPFFAFRAVGEVLGEKALVRLFFVERLSFVVANRQTEGPGSSTGT